MIENARNASTLVVQFADGTKADTGAMPVMPSNLTTYLEVIEEPTSAITPKNSIESVSASPTPQQECPVVVTKATSTNGGFSHALAESLTKSEFQRAMEKANNGGNDPHYLDVRMRNAGNKEVRAVEAYAVYANAMGDEGETVTLLTQNDKSIKPGGEYKSYAVDTSVRSSNGNGDVKVYVTRVRFENSTFWQDNGSHSCSLTSRVK